MVILEDAISEIGQLKGELANRNLEIERLKFQLAKVRKELHGSRSEKLGSEERQAVLFAFPAEGAPVAAAEVTEVPAHTRKVTKRRKALPQDLERERVEYDLENKSCSCCGQEMAVIGEEATEQLEFIPSRFKIIEHVRLKRACSCCKQGVFTPKLPQSIQPLERAQPGPGLLAQIAVSKFGDHAPLARQAEIFERQGIDIPRQRMSDWMLKTGELLTPLADRLWQLVASRDYFHADETEMEVQEDGKPKKLHKGYFWAVLGPPNLVAYHYSKTRAGSVPKELFRDCHSTIQTDAYAGYNPVYLPGACKRLACMAHIRRKFVEVSETAPADCRAVLAIIARLYQIENQLRGQQPENRRVYRLKNSFPELRRLYRLIRQLLKRTLPNSPLGGALKYAWPQRKAVLQFLRDGQFEIDNNPIERMMRSVAIGRKNYLFSGTHEGARAAAVFYTLVNTCKLNQVNPLSYIRDVLVRIHQPGNLDDLLPQNWKPVKSQ